MESIETLKTIRVKGILAQYGLAYKKVSDRISVFQFGECIFTHPELSFEGIIIHIMLQYFLLIISFQKHQKIIKFSYVSMGV